MGVGKFRVHKSILLLWVSFIFSGQANSSNYYFSSSTGSDSYTSTEAQNPATPWQTLAKLNSFMPSLQPGDSVLFKRGDIFYGSVTITRSGLPGALIVFSAYGSGAKPMISGLTYLTSWTLQGANKWEADCPSCGASVNMLIINDSSKAMGRFPNTTDPNKGYLNFESHGSLQITDNQLPSSPNWTGAELVIRSTRYTLEHRLIASHSGGTLGFNSSLAYPLTNGFGYFIQNHPQTLDTYGEWYYNPVTKKVLVYTNSSDPGPLHIAVSTQGNLISMNDRKYISLNNIEFTGSNTQALFADHPTNISVTNCNINLSGANGIRMTGASNCNIENNLFNNSNVKALDLGGSYLTVKNNTIRNSGVFPGMGGSGIHKFYGIWIEGNNMTIEKNTIDSTGFNPITFQGDSILIKNNFITNFGFNLDDGGGIYTWNGCPANPMGIYGIDHINRKITGNIILNGIGAPEGTDNTNKESSGIYLDDNSMNAEVHDNTIANCGLNGIFLHNAYDNSVKQNTSFNNSIQLNLEENGDCTADPIVNNIIKYNIIFSKLIPQVVSRLYSTTISNINSFGHFDTNYYCRPFYEQYIIHTSDATLLSTYSLSQWQTAYNQDSNSNRTPIEYPPYSINQLIGPNKYPNGGFNSNINGVECWSPINNCNVTWDNTGRLDLPGCLRFSFPAVSGLPDSSLLDILIGAIDSTKKYIVRFTIQGTKTNRDIAVNLRKRNSPFTDLSPMQSFNVSTSRQQLEFLLEPTRSDAQSFLQFSIEEADSTIYFDNIELYEANVTMNNPDASIRFEYNATQTPKTVTLANTYIDVKNNVYTTSVTLQPYTSIILLKQLVALPVGILYFKSTCVNSNALLEWATATEANTRSFAVEKSNDGTSWKIIGTVNSQGNSSTGHDYHFTDAEKNGQSAFYRLKQIDLDGKFNYSKTIPFTNCADATGYFSIYPNPCNYSFTIKSKKNIREVIVLNVFDEVVSSLTTHAANVEVNTMALKPGVYFVRTNIEGNWTTTKIIKQ